MRTKNRTQMELKGEVANEEGLEKQGEELRRKERREGSHEEGEREVKPCQTEIHT